MAPYTSLVLRPIELKLPRHSLMAANFKTATSTAKTRSINMRPLNPIPPFIGLSSGAGSTRKTAVSISKSSSSSTVTDDGNYNGNPCLDLFLNLRDAEKAGPNRIEELLSLAWSHNPLTTLKLIYEILPDCSDDTFRTITFWLHQNHPKTLARNLAPIAGIFVHYVQFFCLLEMHLVLKDERRSEFVGPMTLTTFGTEHDLEEAQDVSQHQKEAVENDPEYRFLHEFISDIFVECLKSDIEKLKHNTLNITHAADSFLSMGTNFSDPTLLRQSIARKVFPRESYPEYQGVEEADYEHSVRDRLRNEVLLPLYKVDKLYEAYESKDSVVEKYLEEVKAGKSKISPDALLPNQIVRYVNHWNFGQVTELQWKAMMEGIKKQGKKILNNCLPVCDVMLDSDMYNMDMSVGFTLLMSELNEEPWKGKVINFSQSPELHLIKGDQLKYMYDFLTRRMPDRYVDCKVDFFQKVFDLILEEAVNGNLKPEQMIKKVFVFTQSSFKYCWSKSDCKDSDNNWKTMYEGIQKKFKENGYDNAVPQIVYWKMWDREPREWVMPCKKPGLTMLENYSDILLKLFLDNGGEIRQELSMEAAISGEEYQKLVVVD
ncbi:hypothetical protein CerSpe_186640 [Prunus speciosa]